MCNNHSMNSLSSFDQPWRLECNEGGSGEGVIYKLQEFPLRQGELKRPNSVLLDAWGGH